MTNDQIIQWLEEEREHCIEAHCAIYGEYTGSPLSTQDRESAFWYSGRADTCERLLLLLREEEEE